VKRTPTEYENPLTYNPGTALGLTATTQKLGTGDIVSAGVFIADYTGTDGDGGGIFDNFKIEGIAVPEPSSIALLGLGGLGILARRRRV